MNRDQARKFRRDVKASVKAAGRLALVVESILDLHRHAPISSLDKTGDQYCEACPTHDYGDYEDYPCATVWRVAQGLGVTQ